MSINPLLQQNDLNLFCNSITTNNIITDNDSFSAYLSSTQVMNPATQVVINNNGLLISSPNYNTSTKSYTVPSTGAYDINISVGIDYETTANTVIQFSIALFVNANIYRSCYFQTYPGGLNLCQQNLIINWYGILNENDVVDVRSLGAVVGTGTINTYSANTANTYWSLIKQ